MFFHLLTHGFCGSLFVVYDFVFFSFGRVNSDLCVKLFSHLNAKVELHIFSNLQLKHIWLLDNFVILSTPFSISVHRIQPSPHTPRFKMPLKWDFFFLSVIQQLSLLSYWYLGHPVWEHYFFQWAFSPVVRFHLFFWIHCHHQHGQRIRRCTRLSIPHRG